MLAKKKVKAKRKSHPVNLGTCVLREMIARSMIPTFSK